MQQTLFGQVIATFGRHLLVRTADGSELQARPFGRALTVGVRRRGALPASTRTTRSCTCVEVLPRRTAL